MDYDEIMVIRFCISLPAGLKDYREYRDI